MARILEKTVESVEALMSPFSTSYGFQTLMQKCISTKTKKEEAALIGMCLHQVRSKLGEPSPSHRSVVNCLSFVVYADLLGYKAPFAHIHAVKLAGSSSILLKKLGYLFCSYLLGPSHELSLLMVNTMLRDLSLQASVGTTYDEFHDPLALAAALSASCYLTPLDSLSTILPHVMDKMSHASPFVRGKAVSALQHLALQVTGRKFFHSPEQLSSFLHGKPSSVVCKLLTDPHPSVVVIGLEFMHFLIPQLQHMELNGNFEDSGSTVKLKEDDMKENSGVHTEDEGAPEDCLLKNLVPALVHIQNQILQEKISQEYIFHSVPAPWIQIYIMKLLRLLRKEEILGNDIHKLLIETFKAANRGVLIGWAIIIEVVHTAIATNLPESSFHEIVAVLGKLVIDSGPAKDLIPKWLNSNLLHTSLSLLQCISRSNISAVDYMMTSHDMQDSLSGSVNHADPSIRRLAVSLITSCGSLSSPKKGVCWTAEKICLLLLEECLPKKLLILGLSQPADQWKRECLERIIYITDTAGIPAEGISWQLAVLLRALPLAPDRQTAILIRDRIQRFLLPLQGGLGGAGCDDVPRVKVLKLLEKHCRSRCASSYLLELYVWVLSHFHHLLADTSPMQALQLLIHLGQKIVLNNKKENVSSIVDVLIAIVQGISHIVFKKIDFGKYEGEWRGMVETITSFVKRLAELDGTPQLIDAYSELLRILPHAQDVAKVIKASSINEESKLDFTLSFLDAFICKKLEAATGEKESSAPVPCQPFPPDSYNAELAISVRRQLSLHLPLHCHPWKVDRISRENKDHLDLSESVSLTHLPSSCSPSSYGASLPDEFLSLSMESQSKGVVHQEGETVAWGAQTLSRVWTSSGRCSDMEGSSTTGQSFAKEMSILDQRTHLPESKPQPDLMSLLLHTGNSGIVLNQVNTQPKSSDPLDVLLNDGLHIGDHSS